ncbi:hypothetical protein NX059_006918 [Plenodomus lindquistii]|nr:hypothetical protein NX059_006918 [Plenodomus lindquistii]
MTTSTSDLNEKAALNILIVGAGVCGPAFALMLMRSNPYHTITIIERSPSLRTGGQQIDLKAQGIPIMKKLNLLDTIRSYCVKETGMEIVDKKGRSLLQFGVIPAGEKQKGLTLTNEYEFMRGDMVNMFVEETQKQREKAEANGITTGGITYIFNTTIASLSPHPKGTTVILSTSQTPHHYDLVVGADGQGSLTRTLAFGQPTSASAFKTLNIHAAFYNIPRHPNETSLARVYMGTNRRFYMTRTGDRSETQIYHFLLNATPAESAHLRTTYRAPLSEQKLAWMDLYKDVEWESSPRFLAALPDVADFYACEIAQVKMPGGVWHKGRVVLLGDAGYCPSAFTGKGTTLSLIGAYVLAGELARYGGDVEAALDAYQSVMRAPVEECQKLFPAWQGGVWPTSVWGVWVMNWVFWVVGVLRVDRLVEWVAGLLLGEKKAWELPEYEGLVLDG